VPEPLSLASLLRCAAFTEAASEALRAAHPLVAPHLERIARELLDALAAEAAAGLLPARGPRETERLAGTLVSWLDELLRGPHDDRHLGDPARARRVQLQLELPQAYTIIAVDRVRSGLHAVLREALAGEPARLHPSCLALDQLLDVELAILLEAYREDLLAKNRTAERLATLGQFAASIGHELRNPLGVIDSSVFLLRQRLRQLDVDDARIGKHLAKISAEVERSNKTISDLLELARNRPPQHRAVLASALVGSALATAQLPSTVEVRAELAEGLLVEADPDQLGRVLGNLLINASQAMGGQGRIFIEGGRDEGDVWLRVRDEGPGVPPEARGRIFEALFTTKAKGSGLGLALSRKIAESHGGTLELEPSETGASFLLRVPSHPRPPGT
jgi:two-component system, NtrC family, sensor histidine kinase HydH